MHGSDFLVLRGHGSYAGASNALVPTVFGNGWLGGLSSGAQKVALGVIRWPVQSSVTWSGSRGQHVESPE
jgi:hypothetical protein